MTVKLHFCVGIKWCRSSHWMWCVVLAEAAGPAPAFEQPVQIKFEDNTAQFEFKLSAAADAKVVW